MMPVDYNAPLYQHPQETWSEAKCARLVNRTVKDGLGTPYPFKGYIHDKEAGYIQRYNGGCSRDGEWYQGEERKDPILAEGYEIVVVSTWGKRIIKTPTQ